MRSRGTRASSAVALVLLLASGTVASAGTRPQARPVTAASPAAGLHLAASDARDRGALLGWLAAHQSWSPRLLDRSLLPARGWRLTAGDSEASASFVAPRAAAGTMPDVTRDGVDDVFQITYSPRRYVGRDGRTGRVLWQRDATDLYFALYARLGNPARPALVAQVLSSSGGVDRAGVTAIDAATGRDLWTSATPTTGADAPVGYGAADLTFLAGVTTGPGRADQVVVGSLTGAVGVVGAAAAVAPEVLDGRTGAVVARGVPVVADDVPSVSALGDVTGDGVGDVAVTANGQERQAALYDGATGQQDWLAAGPNGGGFGSYAELLPGADGGHPAVLVTDGGFDSVGMTAFGGDGTELWTHDGLTLGVVADSDGDRVPDVLTIGFTDDGFEVAGVSGRTGRTRYRSRVALPQTTDGSASVGGGPAGDLTGDGVTDVLFRRDVTGSRPLHDAVVVDGRTGRQRTDRALEGYPLGARLAGHGDALLAVTAASRDVTLTARTLQQRLWTQRLALLGVIGPAFLDSGRLTRHTRTHDVLASLFGRAGSDIVALDGSTGAVLWRVHV